MSGNGAVARTEQILAVLVHVCGVPEELAIGVAFVENLEAFLVWLWLAIEGTLNTYDQRMLSLAEICVHPPVP